MKFIYFALIVLVFSNCATIIGGAKYKADIYTNNPNATIKYNEKIIGTNGQAHAKILRSKSNQVTFSVYEEGCKPTTFDFNERSIRVGALIGTIIGWTTFIPNTIIPLPWGVALDFGTGAIWQPAHKNNPLITRNSIKNFTYTLNYEGCENTNTPIIDNTDINKTPVAPKQEKDYTDKLRELHQLYKEGILTEEEFTAEKKKILENK